MIKKKKQQQPCHCFILQCSVSCGRGHKQRNVYCLAKDGSHLESDYCKHLAKPQGHRKCRGGRCPKWKAGAWSQVSNASPLLTTSLCLATWLAPVCSLVFLCSLWFIEGSSGPGWETSSSRFSDSFSPCDLGVSGFRPEDMSWLHDFTHCGPTW